MEEDFADLHRRCLPKIRRLAAQHLPGMTQAEVQNEIEMALWTAWQKYDPDRSNGATFDTFWYTCWMSRKAHVQEAFFRHKRQMFAAYPPGDVPEHADSLLPAFHEVYDFIPPCPVADPLAKRVWHLLALGFQRKEVQAILGIGWRRYEAAIAMLRPHARLALA